MIDKLKQKLSASPSLKKALISCLETNARPRWWVRVFVHPIIIRRGKKSVIRRRVRIDIFPYNACSIGEGAVIEDFATINNGVGELHIGNYSRVGLGCTVIGPVRLGDHVHLAQNVVISGLNHNFEDVTRFIDQQGVSTSQIIIEEDVWIGANAVITAGVHIGRHCVVGAGSVVTKNIPDNSLVVGSPARIIKQYDPVSKDWIKV